MGDQYHRSLIISEHGLQFPLQMIPQEHIKCRERLIQQYHLRLIRHDSGESHSLLLSSGKLSGEPLFQTLQAKPSHHLPHSCFFFTFASFHSGSDILFYRHRWKQRIILKQISDTSLLRTNMDAVLRAVDHFPVQFNLPLIRQLDACNAFQCHTFSASGSSQDSDPGSLTLKPDVQMEASYFFLNIDLYSHLLPPLDMFHLPG